MQTRTPRTARASTAQPATHTTHICPCHGMWLLHEMHDVRVTSLQHDNLRVHDPSGPRTSFGGAPPCQLSAPHPWARGREGAQPPSTAKVPTHAAKGARPPSLSHPFWQGRAGWEPKTLRHPRATMTTGVTAWIWRSRIYIWYTCTHTLRHALQSYAYVYILHGPSRDPRTSVPRGPGPSCLLHSPQYQ